MDSIDQKRAVTSEKASSVRISLKVAKFFEDNPLLLLLEQMPHSMVASIWVICLEGQSYVSTLKSLKQVSIFDIFDSRLLKVALK
ncbi:MAG: hypothetical protein IPI65_17785 [Bacteroidetes bacterium]|nr:hypothetical protein [Bacteroidota bacterium]